MIYKGINSPLIFIYKHPNNFYKSKIIKIKNKYLEYFYVF